MTTEDYYQPGDHPFFIRRSFLLEKEPLPHRSANNKKFYTAVGQRRNRNGASLFFGGVDGQNSVPKSLSRGTSAHPDVREIFATLPRTGGFYANKLRQQSLEESPPESSDGSIPERTSRENLAHENSDTESQPVRTHLDITDAKSDHARSSSRGGRNSTGDSDSQSSDGAQGENNDVGAKPLSRLHRHNFPSFLSETVNRERWARHNHLYPCRLPQQSHSNRELFRRDSEESFSPTRTQNPENIKWEGKFSVLEDDPPHTSQWTNFHHHRPASESMYPQRKKYPDVREIFTWVDDSRRRTIAKKTKLSYFSNSDSSLDSLSDTFEPASATFPKAHTKPSLANQSRSLEFSRNVSVDNKSESGSEGSEDYFFNPAHVNRNAANRSWGTQGSPPVHQDFPITSIDQLLVDDSEPGPSHITHGNSGFSHDDIVTTRTQGSGSRDGNESHYYPPISIVDTQGGSLQAGAFNPVVSFRYDDDGSAHVQLYTPSRRRFTDEEPNRVKFIRKRVSRRKLVCAILCGTFLVLIAAISVMMYVLFKGEEKTPVKPTHKPPFMGNKTTTPLPTTISTVPTWNTTQIDIIGFNGSLRIVNLQYETGMNNPNSNVFKAKATEFCDNVKTVYTTGSFSNNYKSCIVTSFRNGSVIVDFTMEFINNEELHSLKNDQALKNQVVDELMELDKKGLYNIDKNSVKLDIITWPKLPTTTATVSVSTVSTTPSTVETTTHPSTTQTTTELPTTPDDGFVCPTESGFYAHATSCELRYSCIEWKPHVIECQNGTMWSQEVLSCVAYDRTLCLIAIGVITTTTPTTTTTVQTTMESTTDPTVPTSAPFYCVTQGWFPSPHNCRQFIVCESSNTKGLYFTCPNATMWLQESLACVMHDPQRCNAQTGEHVTRSTQDDQGQGNPGQDDQGQDNPGQGGQGQGNQGQGNHGQGNQGQGQGNQGQGQGPGGRG